ARRFCHRAVDASNAGEGVANAGQQVVERQRDDGSAVADSSDQWHRNQESKQGQAGHRLNDVCRAQNPLAQCFVARESNTQQHAEWNRQDHGPGHQQQMLECQLQDLGPIANQKVKGVHQAPRIRSQLVVPSSLSSVLQFSGFGSKAASPAPKARTNSFTSASGPLRNSFAGWTATSLPPANRAMRVPRDRKSTRLNSSHGSISYAV